MKKKTLISIIACVIALVLVIIGTCVTMKHQLEQPKDVTTVTMQSYVAVGADMDSEQATTQISTAEETTVPTTKETTTAKASTTQRKETTTQTSTTTQVTTTRVTTTQEKTTEEETATRIITTTQRQTTTQKPTTTTRPSTTATTTQPTTTVPTTTEPTTQAQATLVIEVTDFDNNPVETITEKVDAGTEITREYLVSLVKDKGYEAMAGVYGDAIGTVAEGGVTYNFTAEL